MKAFYLKEFVLWGLLLGFALLVLCLSPLKVWDSLPICVLLIGLFLYFRQAGEAFRGKLIFKEKLVLELPAHQTMTLNVDKIRDINLVIHLENISFLFISGGIQVKNQSGEILGRIELPKPAGSPNKTIFGEHQILGPPGKTQPRIRTKQLIIRGNQQPQLSLELNLEWNFEGWNTHWERSLPSDKKLHLEYSVRAI